MSVVLHQGDCLDVMRGMDAESVDAVITDPPYGMNYRSNRRVASPKFNSIAGDEDASVFGSIIDDMHRVLRDNTHVYVFCSWHRIDEFKSIVERRFNLKNILVWNKNNHGSGDLKGAFAPKHEFVLFAHKGRRHLTRRIPDVLSFNKVSSARMTHPTEKPVDMLRTFIELSTFPGDVVLDPFAGSGSLGEAARQSGRSAVLIEREDEYAGDIRRRLGLDDAPAGLEEMLA